VDACRYVVRDQHVVSLRQRRVLFALAPRAGRSVRETCRGTRSWPGLQSKAGSMNRYARDASNGALRQVHAQVADVQPTKQVALTAPHAACRRAERP